MKTLKQILEDKTKIYGRGKEGQVDALYPIQEQIIIEAFKEWLTQKQWIKLRGNPETRYIDLDELIRELEEWKNENSNRN